jgi:hypothetical protein
MKPDRLKTSRPQSLGGQARANKLSPERRSEIASEAAAARWKKSIVKEDGLIKPIINNNHAILESSQKSHKKGVVLKLKNLTKIQNGAVTTSTSLATKSSKIKITDRKQKPKLSLKRDIKDATAFLASLGYRVYVSPDVTKVVDILIRDQEGQLKTVVLKQRPTVDWRAFGESGVLMLFPDPMESSSKRRWFLIEHDKLFFWMELKHGLAPSWKKRWNSSSISAELASFLTDSKAKTIALLQHSEKPPVVFSQQVKPAKLSFAAPPVTDEDVNKAYRVLEPSFSGSWPIKSG